MVNGAPAVVAEVDGRVMGLVVLDVRDGKVAAVCGVANASRLGRLAEQWRPNEHDDPLTDLWP
ncbi:MAG: hypothetical protein ACRD0P_10595 [Stackebrandtia sp.]